MRSGIAMVTEDRKRLGLFLHQTVRDNITVCSLGEAAGQWGVVNRRQEHQAASAQIQSLQIKAAGAEAAITSLSGGNQQKCIISTHVDASQDLVAG